MHHDGANTEDEHGDHEIEILLLLMNAAGMHKGGVSAVDESGD
jgi:hypothetical protein